MAKEKDSAKSTREKAAQARVAQQAQEKRRERTVRIVGAIGVVVVVALIIGLAIIVPRMNDKGGGDATPLPSPNPSAALPTSVYPSDSPVAYGVPVGTGTDSVPELAIWEDFQCPSCGALEKLNGQGIEQLANDGKIRLVWRPTAFLDSKLGNQSSVDAISAWGCAIDQGQSEAYHNTLYANQPTQEGDGWTQEQLLGFGEQAGITGAALDAFKKCVTDRTYVGWAVNSTQAFYDAGVQGTPSGTLNGQPIDAKTMADQTALEKAIADAMSQPSPSASASVSPTSS